MSVELSIIFGVIGALGVVFTLIINFKKSVKTEGESDASIKVDIKYITRGVDDIRDEQRTQSKSINDFNARLIVVEQSTKQAHKRIDEINGKKERKQND